MENVKKIVDVFKFPKIGQFRNVVKEVTHAARYVGQDENGELLYDINKKLPTLKFRGSVKLHGTNGGIIWKWNPLTFDYDVQIQSRSRVLTPLNDNAGFVTFLHNKNINGLLNKIMKVYNKIGYTPNIVGLYGEWCGGNIQKGVAINGLEKMFVIFAIKIDNEWLSDDKLKEIKSPDEKIYNILDYQTYEVEIDFNDPKPTIDKISKLVDEVENECPVGKEFGKSGCGEGIVWVSTTLGYTSSKYWFKTKGDKHKTSGSKEKIPVDVEKINSMNELVGNLLTDSRLNQGIDYLKEMNHEIDRKSTGTYVKWVSNDIINEDLDTIIKNGFEPKEINKIISRRASKWFLKYIDEII